MAIQNWNEAPGIHPEQIRVGDIIGTAQPTLLRYTVKMIGGPQREALRPDRPADREPELARRRARAGWLRR